MPLPPPKAHRSHAVAIAATVAVLLALAPADAGAVDLLGMGGMGVNFWFMDLSLGARPHQSVGIGVTGRVHLKVGRFFRVQVGLIQGRFTEDDETQLKRNLIYGAAEGVYHASRRVYVTLGLRIGADHVAMIETLDRFAAAERRIRDVDVWGVAAEPFLTLGLRLAEKYHLEVESGAAVSWLDGTVNVSYVITLGVFFRMGGRG